MQYLVSVIDDMAGLATPEEQATTDAFGSRLKAKGYRVFASGLAAPGTATVVRPAPLRARSWCGP